MNSQNIPRELKDIKNCFVPKRDILLFADFSQIEYRLLAFYLSTHVHDHKMTDMFKSGLDFHLQTAKELFDKEEIIDEERSTAKTFNFLTIYGGGAGKAQRSLDISVSLARQLQDKYHNTFPAIKLLHNPPFKNGGWKQGEGPGLIQKQLEKRGYLKTLLGRHLNPKQGHAALNYIIQGSAADIFRLVFVNTSRELRENFESRIVNPVHDELMLDCWEHEVPGIVNLLIKTMDYPIVSEVVPIEIDIEASRESWGKKAPIEEALGYRP